MRTQNYVAIFGLGALGLAACAASMPPVIAMNPITITGFGPILVTRNWARPAQTTALPAVAAKATPVFSAE